MRVAGRPVGPRLRAGVPALSRRVTTRLRTELPVYAQLPGEELDGDIADIVQRTLRLFADVIERRRPPDDAELERQRESAGQRAEEGVPLDSILTAYHLGAAMAWEVIAEGAGPGDLTDLQELFALTLDLQRRLTSAVSGAYLDARQVLDAEDHGGRHALLAALLAGEIPPGGRPAGFGMRPAAAYAVLALALGPHPDEDGTGPRAAIAARRKLRRVREVLNAYAGEPALTALDARGGTALLPVPPDAPPQDSGAVEMWPELCATVRQAADAAGAELYAAAEVAAPGGVPEAVARTGEVVALARRTGRPPGLYRLSDVLLEYQLTRPSAALPQLAALLEPLDGRPELLATVEEYVRCGQDRRVAAEALHVHPNTVDYRLRRVAALTGLSAGSASDLAVLRAALVARRV
ncbi:PucR family transcriptional regulator [Streptomyces sp. A7024]|uniref:PucR family transcriptional regulator n=1 Tax=Streptomyces coryli TaxID=1128680 RepID=A0A6G4U136_9ACTN|nr:helix-turn-helix domain-containing protein [Streptomyces coryli]NGN65470.1 PucR family transcriptional regulator [Streptomyces coryli]